MATTGKSQESPWEGTDAFLFAKVPTTTVLFPNPGGGQMSVFSLWKCIDYFFILYFLCICYISALEVFLMNQKAESWFPCANPMQ